MVIISDLHLGNPYSSIRRRTVRFIQWVSEKGYDLCINGDGFEVTQVSMACLARDIPEVLQAINQAIRKGTKIYYVVGNHDILFEHFLSDWGGLKLAPFINLESGGKRFRLEHGHLYDPFFIKFPRAYEFCTRLAGLALAVHPSLYVLWIRWEKMRSGFKNRAADSSGIPGEPRNFSLAAREIANRGFDGVVFGHTHHHGKIELRENVYYFNPGSWMLNERFVLIEQGRAELCSFSDKIA